MHSKVSSWKHADDLSVRDWIEGAWPFLSDAIQQHREAELDVIDQRFRSRTIDNSTESLGRYFRIDATRSWWWRRVPRLLIGELAADLGSTDLSDDG